MLVLNEILIFTGRAIVLYFISHHVALTYSTNILSDTSLVQVSMFNSVGWASVEQLVAPVRLFELASQQARWLSVRQSTIAQNVANANTPGYQALDVEPFESVLSNMPLQMATTHLAHMTDDGSPASSATTKPETPWEILHSRNSVSLEQEMINAGDVNRAFSLNTNIVKAFHRMLLASVKG
jgi:flagellar basal-body rod protein FlgB